MRIYWSRRDIMGKKLRKWIRFFVPGVGAIQIAEKSYEVTHQAAVQRTLKTTLLSDERMVQDSFVTADDCMSYSRYQNYWITNVQGFRAQNEHSRVQTAFDSTLSKTRILKCHHMLNVHQGHTIQWCLLLPEAFCGYETFLTPVTTERPSQRLDTYLR